MQHTLQTEQWIPRRIDEVFLFFADPNNLPRLMPRWQRARIESSSLVPPPMTRSSLLPSDDIANRLRTTLAGSGSTLTISFRPLPMSPVRISWHALIRDFTWNSHFCDEQLHGPFRSWLHCHHVRAERRNGVDGTLVTDRLSYSLPGRFLGDLADALAGARQIQAVFRHRQRCLAQIFPAPPAA